ncbi:MAG TPA: YitT family protein [Isosphaeraceae bacterium]|nr:YitT family protein [Isosphaeraceae bacterium]
MSQPNATRPKPVSPRWKIPPGIGRLVLRELRNVLGITLGILSAGFGLHGFLLSSRFIDGGATGVSMLLADIFRWPLPLLIPLINLPFIALGFRQIGKAFAIRSALAILGLSICLSIIHYPDMTHDRLLTAVFGGFFIGMGMALAMRGGAVLDGTDIAALLISKKIRVFRVGDVILGGNLLIFLVAAGTLGGEKAMYSILTYIAATKTLDFVLHGIEQYTAIWIVSARNESIRQAITGELGRGVTVYKGRGGHRGGDLDILYCVVTRLEIGRVLGIAQSIDPSAFISVFPLADVQGGVVKRSGTH